MKKKFLAMLFIGVMAMSITACGEKETVVENVDEVVLEGDAPLDDDVDSGTTGKETIDLTNTTILNIGESNGYTLNMPVYTFAYSETNPYGISYIAQNVDGNNFYESYVLSFSDYSNADNAEEALDFMEREMNSYVGYDDVEKVEIKGDVNSDYIILYAYSAPRDNGTEKNIQDVYYVYDATGTNIYRIKLNIAKDSVMYGADVLEKSTEAYRQEFLNAMITLANK